MYRSTRSDKLFASDALAVLEGIAPDGGLYVPFGKNFSDFDWKDAVSLSEKEISKKVLSFLLSDFSEDEISRIVDDGYRGKFENDCICPIKEAGDVFILELFRGPTSAFKDVALSLLPHFITAASKKEGGDKKTVILTATSGDTGKAALEGFRDVENTHIFVFFPENGVSAVQKKQMVSQEGKNVTVCGILGNFDDAQTGVKRIFAEFSKSSVLDEKKVRLSSANSINIARLAPQVMYYFSAYAKLLAEGKITLGEEVNFAVPTGNFGNILAGYMAREMGLPVAKLICASNENCVLYDFIRTGTYSRKRPFIKTLSPSMDILVSSNLERLLFFISGGDFATVSRLMKELSENGEYTVSESLSEKIKKVFYPQMATDTECKAAIKRYFEKYGYLSDTHTAIALDAAEKFQKASPNGKKTIVLSTASPYKFSGAVLSAIGEAEDGDEFSGMKKLNAVSGVPIPKNLALLDSARVLHKNVIAKEDMARFILERI